MAIISQYTSEEFGITSSNAYTKLISFYVMNQSPTEKTLSISTETWIDKQARLDNKLAIGRNMFSMPLETELFTFADIYTYIKQQPQFISPIDDI
jgi:hypothetical protein